MHRVKEEKSPLPSLLPVPSSGSTFPQQHPGSLKTLRESRLLQEMNVGRWPGKQGVWHLGAWLAKCIASVWHPQPTRE